MKVLYFISLVMVAISSILALYSNNQETTIKVFLLVNLISWFTMYLHTNNQMNKNK